MTFKITGSVGDQRKRNRVRLGKTILRETFHLAENLLGKFRLDAIIAHTLFQLDQQWIQVAVKVLDSPGTDFLA